MFKYIILTYVRFVVGAYNKSQEWVSYPLMIKLAEAISKATDQPGIAVQVRASVEEMRKAGTKPHTAVINSICWLISQLMKDQEAAEMLNKLDPEVTAWISQRALAYNQYILRTMQNVKNHGIYN